jgi:hypothetical protein
MHEKLITLKSLPKAGDYDKASEALKAYRTEFPDDWNGKLMEGISAQLRGEEENFHRIYDETQAVIDQHVMDSVQIQTSPLWEKVSFFKEEDCDRSGHRNVAAGAVVEFVHIYHRLSYHIINGLRG